MRTFVKCLIVAFVVVFVIAGVWVYFQFQLVPKVKIDDAQHARAAFTKCLDDVDDILAAYNLSTEPYRQDQLDEETCNMSAEVPIDENSCLYLDLSYDPGYYPKYMIYIERASIADLDACYVDLNDYPYLFEIASLFSNNWHAKQFKPTMSKLQQRLQNYIQDNGFDMMEWETEALRVFGIYQAESIDYGITEMENGSGYEVAMIVFGMLSTE